MDVQCARNGGMANTIIATSADIESGTDNLVVLAS
jgi:hypothetical protein